MDRFEKEEREHEAQAEPLILSPCPECGVVSSFEAKFDHGTGMAATCGNCLHTYSINMAFVKPKHWVRWHDSAKSAYQEDEYMAHHYNEGRIKADEC